MKSGWIKSYYKYLQKNWNAIVAALSVMGYFSFSLFPDTERYQKVFLFLGANAIIWTVIELKVSMTRESLPGRYEDMRAARPDILNKIKKAISQRRKEELEIHIVGGRIRTISDMIREIRNDILTERLRARRVKFFLYCLDPEFVGSWNLRGIKEVEAFKARNQSFSDLIKQFTQEMQEYNKSELLKKNEITLEVIPYNCFPSFYAFVIGKSMLFWGFFTWNNESEDFEGPTNPCFYIEKDMDHFDDYYTWVQSRVTFFQVACHSTREGRAD
jgi:hypothetical protein